MGKSFLVTVTNDLNQDQRMHRICKSLSEAGHIVTFLGRIKPTSSQLLNLPFSQKRVKCFFSKGFLFYLEYNIRIFFFAMKMKPDVIYSVDLDTILGGGMAARLLKSKQIHDAHEYFVEVPELEGRRFKKWIWNKIGKSIIPKCDLCYSVNQELADILSDKYRNEFYVVRSVPNLNDKEAQERKANNPKVILYQGVLNAGRGLEEAVKAVSSLKHDVVLKIAGEGDISEELRRLVNNLKVNDKVVFLGWLSPDQLKQETLQADIGLNLLSVKSLNYKYSLANKFFDYMHAGVPSINMNFPVYKRICKEFEVGVCIEDLDQHSIQSAIITLVESPSKIEKIKAACISAKSKYNWQNESIKMIDLIRKHI